MRFFCLSICAVVILLLSFSPTRAETVPSPTPFEKDPQSGLYLEDLVGGLEDFAKNFSLEVVLKTVDEGMGGFVFWTPDFFSRKIALKNGVTIQDLAGLRDMFLGLAVPIIAIMIAFQGIGMVNSQDTFLWKPFIERTGLTVFLLIFTPYLLSLTIWANNLLVEAIFKGSGTSSRVLLSEEYSQFMEKNFLAPETDNNSQKDLTAVAANEESAPESLKKMFFQTLPSIIGPLGYIGYFASGQSQPPGQAASQLTIRVLGTIIFFFLLVISLVVVTLQCVARFLSLLLLSLLYPLAMPFMMLEKTKQVVKTYFKTWISFLIQQPAFVLGYVIVFAAIRSLKSQMLNFDNSGLGLLLFNLGALVFIGSTPTLASHLFSEAWTVGFTAERGTQIRRTVESTVSSLVGGKLSSLKRQGIGGLLGNQAAKKLGLSPLNVARSSDTSTTARKAFPLSKTVLSKKLAPDEKPDNQKIAPAQTTPLVSERLNLAQRASGTRQDDAFAVSSNFLGSSSTRIKKLSRPAAIKNKETREGIARKEKGRA